MSSSDASSLDRDVSRKAGLYETLVLRSLTPMVHGRLAVRLPDGSVRRLGGGSNPRGAKFGLSAGISVRDGEFFRRCLFAGDIGFAESYMAGEWETDDLTEVISWFILNAENSPSLASARRRELFLRPLAAIDRVVHRLRRNSVAGSRRNIAAHYDLSNDFFRLFLDESMIYSSAIFERPDMSIEAAQQAKIERICALLALEGGEECLEIGCGWGAVSIHLAKTYGCRVTAITISEGQYSYARQKVEEEGLEKLISVRLEDYRRVEGRFDRIVSIEMLEAVGHEYLDAFFRHCHRLLNPNGLMALQVITCPDSRYEAVRKGTDFIQKHIFPGGLIPSVGAIVSSVSRTGDLTLRELSSFGDSYSATLAKWSLAFESRLDEVRALGFDETFIRKWRYYFAYCRAAFQMRHIDVVQMLFTRPNNHTTELTFK